MAIKKLELIWIGKDKIESLEPRIMIENQKKSNSLNDYDVKNIIIHGDNLLALKSLLADYSRKIKRIYIDPPYNTGKA